MSNSLNVITGINFIKGELDAINNMTYFFNPNYDTNNAKYSPIVFFYMTGFEKTKIAEVNTNPLILYDDSTAMNANRTNYSTQRVIADNIVLQPTKINIDAIIPYRATDMNYFKNLLQVGIDNGAWGLAGISAWAYNNTIGQNQIIKSIASLFSNNVQNAALRMLQGENIAQSFLVSDMAQIDTLEDMVDRKLPLKLKLPFGWKFAQATITNLTYRKETNESDVVRARIECIAELPIIRVVNNNTALKTRKVNSILKTKNDVLYNIFKGL